MIYCLYYAILYQEVIKNYNHTVDVLTAEALLLLE